MLGESKDGRAVSMFRGRRVADRFYGPGGRAGKATLRRPNLPPAIETVGAIDGAGWGLAVGSWCTGVVLKFENFDCLNR